LWTRNLLSSQSWLQIQKQSPLPISSKHQPPQPQLAVWSPTHHLTKRDNRKQLTSLMSRGPLVWSEMTLLTTPLFCSLLEAKKNYCSSWDFLTWKNGLEQSSILKSKFNRRYRTLTPPLLVTFSSHVLS
jgi:hypothetical protein